MSLTQCAPYPQENGYGLYECNCCPYGYHIDLDFVRYCESISHEAERTGSIKRRRDRRRQRQSMEVLLGITPPITLEQNYKPISEQESLKIHQKQTSADKFTFLHQDDFEDVVSDFEKTLQYSKNKLSNNLPDVTAVTEIRRIPSISSISTASNSSMTVLPPEATGIREFDTVSIESCGLSPLALQKIREQMALSLERTKELEEKVKLIPGLEATLVSLEEENLRLQTKLKETEESKLNADYIISRARSQSFNEANKISSITKKEPPPPPPRKDFGVTCGVLTRNVGVGHLSPSTKNVSTTTLNGYPDHSDKWYSEKLKFLNSSSNQYHDTQKSINITSRSTQTIQPRERRHTGVQAVLDKPAVPKLKADHSTQTTEAKKTFVNVGLNVGPKCKDFFVQKNVECVTVGVSEDSIDCIICEKCSVAKKTVAVGPETNEDSHTSPVSLAALMGPRSKSFNLGEDKLNFSTARHRTVACQSENFGVSKSCQSVIKTHTRSSQHDIKTTEKITQYESHSPSKNTDTRDLIVSKNAACEAKENKAETMEVAVNTAALEKSICPKCSPNSKGKEEAVEKEEVSKKEVVKKEEVVRKEEVVKKEGGSPTPSRIPRPQIPTTPVEARKFRRQDTYTKVYEKTSTSGTGLSNLELSTKSLDSSGSLERTKSLQLQESNSISQNGITASTSSTVATTKVHIQEGSLPMLEKVIVSPSSDTHRKKAEPSKEMSGALKVLNDSLHKTNMKNVKNNNAINIAQQEWFKIASHSKSNPLDVEDYLDAFEDISSLLLEYVVNMTDSSGNTVMHYAVSHGNFDIVSILLDSKVCDINKPNKAGYTCVMLVSLAQVKSQAHAGVVKRLFQLADVNIRAKQHGQTALMLAVSHGRLDMVKMLVEAGADINIQDADGSTALMCAAEHGHTDIVKYFLNQPDCDSSITDVDGSTALKIAMEAGHRHIGVLLYAHERNLQMMHGSKIKKTKIASPKTPSSPLPIRSSHRALSDTKTTK